jgi:hypothetical protein
MATELDRKLDRIMDTLTGAGQPFETMPFERFGRELPALRIILRISARNMPKSRSWSMARCA